MQVLCIGRVYSLVCVLSTAASVHHIGLEIRYMCDAFKINGNVLMTQNDDGYRNPHFMH